MTLHDITLGGTYRLRSRRHHNPTVVVESVEVDHALHTPWLVLVWVYEAKRHIRYPCLPSSLGPCRQHT